jgi:hypothetical protein
MSGMDGKAFSSPVAAATVATNACGSVGERVVRGSCIGVLQDNIKCGMELNAVKLCPFEVAVQVVQVLDESVWTGEIVGERLGQCIDFVICWRRADVRSISGGTSSVAESGAG